jgi:tRNA (guanine37-N1)-methyltransferase
VQVYIFTLFPAYFSSSLDSSILGRAIKKDLVTIKLINIRDFTTDKYQTADDRPYGGGAGMVMKIEPIDLALKEHGFTKGTGGEKIVLTSAKGEMFNQQTAKSWQALDRLAIICGHYEGVDERVAEHLIDEEMRIGDYVLTGGEPAAAVMVDAVVRLIPGVLGNETSNLNESHDVPGELGHAQYTRPEKYLDWCVPEILLSGDPVKIEKWRKSLSR